MRIRTLSLFALLALLLPQASRAEVKSYSIDILRMNNTTTLTVTGASFPSWRFGNVEINDESNAQPTLDRIELLLSTSRSTRTDVFGGVNSFVHTRALGTIAANPGQTGTGDSEGFVQWNPLSSWTPGGGNFCKSSNEIGNPLGGSICALVGFSQESTIANTIPSPTYDFTLWTFDAEGDFSAAPFIWQINSNGSSNQEYLIQGNLNVNVPALSIVGLGILTSSILFLGVRALRSRKDG